MRKLGFPPRINQRHAHIRLPPPFPVRRIGRRRRRRPRRRPIPLRRNIPRRIHAPGHRAGSILIPRRCGFVLIRHRRKNLVDIRFRRDRLALQRMTLPIRIDHRAFSAQQFNRVARRIKDMHHQPPVIRAQVVLKRIQRNARPIIPGDLRTRDVRLHQIKLPSCAPRTEKRQHQKQEQSQGHKPHVTMPRRAFLASSF